MRKSSSACCRAGRSAAGWRRAGSRWSTTTQHWWCSTISITWHASIFRSSARQAMLFYPRQAWDRDSRTSASTNGTAGYSVSSNRWRTATDCYADLSPSTIKPAASFAALGFLPAWQRPTRASKVSSTCGGAAGSICTPSARQLPSWARGASRSSFVPGTANGRPRTAFTASKGRV